MSFSRRDLSLLLPVLAAARASGQGQPPPALASKVYHYHRLPVRSGEHSKNRRVLLGKTHANFELEMHETELVAGSAPHGAHRHVHEEILVLREGTIEVTIEGRAETLQPGSVAYIASNEMHGWRNPGATPCKYFIIELRDRRLSG